MKNILHQVAFFVHNFFAHHKFTAKDLQSVATLANIYTEVKADTAHITDPAELTKAIAMSVIKHEHELPTEMQGTGLEAGIITICQNLSGLPLAEIEAIVKEALGKK